MFAFVLLLFFVFFFENLVVETPKDELHYFFCVVTSICLCKRIGVLKSSVEIQTPLVNSVPWYITGCTGVDPNHAVLQSISK